MGLKVECPNKDKGQESLKARRDPERTGSYKVESDR